MWNLNVTIKPESTRFNAISCLQTVKLKFTLLLYQDIYIYMFYIYIFLSDISVWGFLINHWHVAKIVFAG